MKLIKMYLVQLPFFHFVKIVNQSEHTESHVPKILFVYICLNLLNEVHVFMSSLQLFHRLTPLTDMQCVFVFVRTVHSVF